MSGLINKVKGKVAGFKDQETGEPCASASVSKQSLFLTGYLSGFRRYCAYDGTSSRLGAQTLTLV